MNSTPNLKLALLGFIHVFGIMPASYRNRAVAGCVPSPTPIAPISVLSIRVILIGEVRFLTRYAAASQPLVPPPKIIISLTLLIIDILYVLTY